jgi:hypothetical protein
MILKFYHHVRKQVETYECTDMTVVPTAHFDMHYYTTVEGLVFMVHSKFGDVFETDGTSIGSKRS